MARTILHLWSLKPRSKLKPVSLRLSTVKDSLTVLKESADVFPPLKSAVGAVLELVRIAEARYL